MPCLCNRTPCICANAPPPTTMCDLYRPGDRNVWMERADQVGNQAPGICLLDSLSRDQVIYSIERDDVARADLLRITSNPDLRDLAETVTRLPTQELVDMEQTASNRPAEPATIPFYALFRGQPPFAQ